MKKTTHVNFLFLGVMSLLPCLIVGMDNKPIKKNLDAPQPTKVFIKNIEKAAEQDRALSPTISPSPKPKKNTHKRPKSPLSTSTTLQKKEKDKKIENASLLSPAALLKLAENGNLLELQKELLPRSKTKKSIPLFGQILHVAIKKDRFNIVRELLEKYNKNIDIEYLGSKKQTPLISASKKSSAAIVHHLLAYGANINAQSKKGDTPLHKTARFGRVEAMQLLLSYKEEIEIETKNLQLKTALWLTVEQAQLGAFSLLKANGADISMVNQSCQNLLHIAVISGYLPILLSLLTTDLDLDACDGSSHTPLAIARQMQDKTLIRELKFYKNKRKAKSKD